LGPGAYVPDQTFTRIEDLPEPKLVKHSRNYPLRACPQCGQAAPRHTVFTRHLHDLGDLVSGRPHELELTYSQHYCTPCAKYFNTDTSDLAPPRGQYTQRVMTVAVRLVVEDGLPYREASWQLWRDHRVFVPFATIQNWVEAGGEKGECALGN
jgi:transposase